MDGCLEDSEVPTLFTLMDDEDAPIGESDFQFLAAQPNLIDLNIGAIDMGAEQLDMLEKHLPEFPALRWLCVGINEESEKRCEKWMKLRRDFEVLLVP